MKSLRSGAISQFLRQLDHGVFSQHNFDTSFNEQDGTLASVVFGDDPNFYFKILQPKTSVNKTGQWRTLESPGQFFTSEEEYENRDFNTAHSRARAWVARVVEELVFAQNKNGDWLQTLRSNLEAAANSLPEPETPFSEAEVADWSRKFDDLLARLEGLESENKIQQGVVTQLKQQLNELQKQGVNIPKRTWLKTAGHKILDVFEHGAKAGTEAIAKGAVKALLGS